MARRQASNTGKARSAGKTNRTTMPRRRPEMEHPEDEFGFYSDTPAEPKSFSFPPEQFELQDEQTAEEEPREEAEDSQPEQEEQQVESADPRSTRKAPRQRRSEAEPRAVVSPAGTLWNFLGLAFTGFMILILLFASVVGGEDIKNSHQAPVTPPPPIVTPEPIALPEETPVPESDPAETDAPAESTAEGGSPIEIVDTPAP